MYCIVTAINSMMDLLFMHSSQLFRTVGQYVIKYFIKYGVNILLPNVGIGVVRYTAQIVCVLMVAFLLLAVYRVYHRSLRTLKVFVEILCQFLCVFCACLLALVVYNDHGKMIDIVQSTFAEASSYID